MSSSRAGSMGTGIEMKPAHFPGRVPIDSYGGGGFRFADMSHRGSILCLPSGIYGWSVESMADATAASFAQLKEEDGPELLLIGTGVDLLPLSEPLTEYLSHLQVRCEPMSTGAAARTYNVLLSEGRSVGAALIAVE